MRKIAKLILTSALSLFMATPLAAGDKDHNSTVNVCMGVSIQEGNHENHTFTGGGIALRLCKRSTYLESRIDTFNGILGDHSISSIGLKSYLFSDASLNPYAGAGAEYRFYPVGDGVINPYVKGGLKLFDLVYFEYQHNIGQDKNTYYPNFDLARVGLEFKIR